MDFSALSDNLTNPALLFFFLGIIASVIKSDLCIPENSSKFISIYLMFSIGFKGGQELSHSILNTELIGLFGLGILSSLLIPVYCYYILKKKFNAYDSAAIAAAYGSVSAVTFITAVSYLELNNIEFDGYMVAVMAAMEAPAIFMGVLLFAVNNSQQISIKSFKNLSLHSFQNGSVLLLLGCILIGFFASEAQARGIEPFTTDIFKGFLAVFLLDMGIQSGKHLKAFKNNGKTALIFSIIIPIINGCIMALISGYITENIGNRLLIAILAASASYIAVPAAMRISIPKANPGLYLPMALAITFPFNISLGIPLYLSIIKNVGA